MGTQAAYPLRGVVRALERLRHRKSVATLPTSGRTGRRRGEEREEIAKDGVITTVKVVHRYCSL